MARPAKRSGDRAPAPDLPVARVTVDVSLPHLDRPFDYLVPLEMADAAVPGCRVRVRFAGKLTSGYILERAAASEHPGRLAFLERLVSPDPVLTPETVALAREVASRYAGTLADVLRLAIPPRHAAAERAAAAEHGPVTEQSPAAQTPGPPSEPALPAPEPALPAPGDWSRYPAG